MQILHNDRFIRLFSAYRTLLRCKWGHSSILEEKIILQFFFLKKKNCAKGSKSIVQLPFVSEADLSTPDRASDKSSIVAECVQRD